MMSQSVIVIPTNISNAPVDSVQIYLIVAMEVKTIHNLTEFRTDSVYYCNNMLAYQIMRVLTFYNLNRNLCDMLQMLTAPTPPMRSIVRTRKKFAQECRVDQYGVATQRHALWIHGEHLEPSAKLSI